MDPIHIHNLLRQLSHEVHCPHCDARIRPDMISIRSSTQNHCLLDIDCHECGEVFHGHAHVGVRVVSPDGPNNTVPQLPTASSASLPDSPPAITQQDLYGVRWCLNQPYRSFSGLFSMQK